METMRDSSFFQLIFLFCFQENPKIKRMEIEALCERLVEQVDERMSDLEDTVKRQKIAEEEARLRKIKEEMEADKRQREEEEAKKREDEENRRRKAEMEARRKMEEEQRRIQELEDKKTAAALRVSRAMIALLSKPLLKYFNGDNHPWPLLFPPRQ